MKQWKNSCIVVLLLVGAILLFPEDTKAAGFTNAYDFYQTYGEEVVFRSGSDKEGLLYFCTKAKRAGSTVKTTYSNLGWKVSVVNSAGRAIDAIYYAMGGEHLITIDKREVNSITYHLYALTFSDMKSRLSSEARRVLETANCNIVFDACTVVKKSGTPQGDLSDNGVRWGTVYTTYDGIVNAARWSATTKELLKSYYGKNIVDMFYTVHLYAGNGIKSVSGAGKYCYGTTVTIDAVVQPGYAFLSWSGSTVSNAKRFSFVLYDSDVSLTAKAKNNEMTIAFYRNWDSGDTMFSEITYTLDTEGQKLKERFARKIGYRQVGWSTSRTGPVEYQISQVMESAWLRRQPSRLVLYGIWDPNDYTIVFDSNGAQGSIAPCDVTYGEEFTLPSSGLRMDGKQLIGWCRYPDERGMDYYCGESVNVSDIAQSFGVSYENGATITLYPVWDNGPRITGRDLYLTLEDARDGKITEEWICRQFNVSDEEDGVIAYGRQERSCFYLMDYSPSDFTQFQASGSVTETCYAVDSVGNVRTRTFVIYIVDAGIVDDLLPRERVRFISEEYLKDASGNWISEENGGLWEDSLWRTDGEYLRLLERLWQMRVSSVTV